MHNDRRNQSPSNKDCELKDVFVHPTAIVESNTIGKDSRIWAYVHVMRGASIGNNCNIGDHGYVETGAVIGDNVTIKNHVCVWEGIEIEDDVFVGPYVSFTNDLYPRSGRMPESRTRHAQKENWLVRTVIEKGCSIGANATVLGGVRLGRYCFVAAGAIVTRDVEPYSQMIGCPANRAGYMCRCGRRLGPNLQSSICPQCGILPDLPRVQTDEYCPRDPVHEGSRILSGEMAWPSKQLP